MGKTDCSTKFWIFSREISTLPSLPPSPTTHKFSAGGSKTHFLSPLQQICVSTILSFGIQYSGKHKSHCCHLFPKQPYCYSVESLVVSGHLQEKAPDQIRASKPSPLFAIEEIQHERKEVFLRSMLVCSNTNSCLFLLLGVIVVVVTVALFCFLLLLLFFHTEFLCLTALATLEFTDPPLPLPPQCWDERHESPYQSCCWFLMVVVLFCLGCF